MKKMPVIAGTIVVVGIVVGIFIAVPITTSASSYPVLEVSDGQVYAIGETATINITLSEAPNGLSGYNLSISLSNASVAEIISVSFPAWATLHSNSSLPADSVWIKAVDLNDKIKRGEKNITLAILTVRGDNYGDTEIITTVTKMDDDEGNPINPSIKYGKFDPSPSLYFNPQYLKTEVDSKAIVNLVLEKAPNGLSGYNLTVSLSNPEIAEIISVDFPEWATTLHINSSLPADSVWMKCVDLRNQVKSNDTNITLTTITLICTEKGKTDLVITVTKMDDDSGNPINVSAFTGLIEVVKACFDTGPGTYPSIPGTHICTIIPSENITVSKLYTYPCPGTGGHTEYAAIAYTNGTVIAEAHWNGYIGDWHSIFFNKKFILFANQTYNLTIRTGSYPQIIHEHSKEATGGTITCISFVDANGRRYSNWIPAIRLE